MSRFIDRTGEWGIASNGMKMVIIAYRRYSDIDIQFEDGTNVFGKDYGSFKKGSIAYPQKARVGEEGKANNGMLIKIIAYRGCYDVDIQFEDGTIVRNKSYSCFKKGAIGYPQIDRVGEENTASNGMSMKIIAYRAYNDIDVQFEDGTIVNNKTYGSFKTE